MLLRMVDDDVLDRAAGCLVGLAVGDALGAPYEFGIPGPAEPEMRGGGIGPWEPGEWTDDTQQAICVAQGRAEPVGVAARLLAWYRAQPKDVGVQTRAVLRSAASGEDLAEIAASLYDARPDRSAGNGSLMRTAPVALAHLGDDRALASHARAISALTHADPLCTEACVVWTVAIDRAIREQRLDGVHNALHLVVPQWQAQWVAVVDQVYRMEPADFVPNGFVVTALQAAYAAIVHTPAWGPDHFRRAILNAIRIGHDTDTVGAIAGALLGARWGLAAIPPEWRARVHGWPGLDAGGLAQLARALVNG